MKKLFITVFLAVALFVTPVYAGSKYDNMNFEQFKQEVVLAFDGTAAIIMEQQRQIEELQAILDLVIKTHDENIIEGIRSSKAVVEWLEILTREGKELNRRFENTLCAIKDFHGIEECPMLNGRIKRGK